jgi:hypothetical protein
MSAPIGKVARAPLPHRLLAVHIAGNSRAGRPHSTKLGLLVGMLMILLAGVIVMKTHFGGASSSG